MSKSELIEHILAKNMQSDDERCAKCNGSVCNKPTD